MSVTRRDFLSGAGAAALAAAFPRCASANARSNESRLNLLLFIADDLGATLGCYGDGQARTPHLDGFAYECVRFERAFVTMASCSPSRSSILSGLYPHQNGQIGLAHYSYSMAPGLPNLVSLLKEAGYRTGIIGKLHVNPASDFPYDDRGLEHSRTRDVRAAAADAGRFFAENGQRPFFLHFNVVDPHTPLLDQYQGLPERPMRADEATVWPWIGLDHPTLRQRIAGYYNCVSRVDTAFGLVLDELRKHGLEENTLIVVLGDHGPPFTRGKASIYEAGLRIPLLVRWPGRSRPGVVRREMVSTIDLLPTLCEAAGAPLPTGLPGRSMAPLIGDRKARWRELLFAEYTTHPPEWFFPMRSVRDDRCKLIHNLLAPARPNPITLMDNCPAR
ncbi:sulfatase [bacterium]|nr:sulfatase [bacterium]